MDVLPDLSNDLLMWTLVVGGLLPLVIAFVNQSGWSGPAKAIVTIVVCTIVGAGTAWFNGAFTGRGVISSVLIVLTMALFTHSTIWRPSGITPGIERATSSTPSR